MHDLALALGGMTVGELKNRMSLAELAAWQEYIKTQGPVNPMLRMDAGFARWMAFNSKNGKVRDFMPWPVEPEQEGTAEQAFAMFKGLARSNRKH